MSGLRLYTSNRLEELVKQLAETMRQPLCSVLQSEKVVVQSLGMRRWLALELAARHGICANVEFPFPQTLVGGIFKEAFPKLADEGCYDPTAMTWRVMKVLPSLLDQKEFATLGNYLNGGQGELKLFQLAGRIAHTFDRYLAFRPELILAWDEGKEKHWQAMLWRELTSGIPLFHQPALARELATALSKGTASFDALPQRISVFGISTLPQFYIDLMGVIASRIDVHFFLMEPTPEWWGEVRSEREQAKILRKQKKAKLTASELHLDSGNSLLSSMGKLGREFLGIVHSLDPAQESEAFVAPDESTMLGCMQADIFRVSNPGEKHRAYASDTSIQVHACHSPMREIEVLHDQLLARFAGNPALQPKDILVMMPDLETYAPFVEAVFDVPEDEKTRIPFTVADRANRTESNSLDTFLRILELVGTRLGVSSVLAVLESPAVQRKFDLAEADLETIRVWIKKTAIRWGIDTEHRAKFDVPKFAQNTWREGLDRMLLGYALPGGGERLFEGLLPFDEIEGGLAQTLGSFIEFATELFDVIEDFERPRPLDQWQRALRSAVDRLFADSDETGRELLLVRRVIDSLAETMRLSGFDENMEFAIVLAYLSQAFAAEERGSGFLAGRVTFCALKPMRSIPAKVLCLLGMNDTAFPRHAPALSFDLIAQNPKPGDRTMRDDDRYLFLEALLSAREALHISFCGQSMRDNSALSPSVLVRELLDYLERHFEFPEKKSVADFVVTKHKLQPFSADYFNGKLFRYSQENCRASDAAQRERQSPAPFFTTRIAPPEEEWRTVDVADLVRFFRNPSQFLARKRFGIHLIERDDALDDREPFEFVGLTKYNLEQTLAEKSLSRIPLETMLPLALAAGELPPAHVGESTFHTLASDAEKFAKLVKTHSPGTPQPSQTVALAVDAFTITGAIDGLTTDGLVRYRNTAMKPKDMLALWIPLVVLNCIQPCSGVLIAEDKMHFYRAVENPEAILRGLLELYWNGLHEPLKFFPQTSWQFAKLTFEPKENSDPMEAAVAKWEGSDFNAGEKEDAYFDLAFRNVSNPLDAEWEDITSKVFEPLLQHCEEKKA